MKKLLVILLAVLLVSSIGTNVINSIMYVNKTDSIVTVYGDMEYNMIHGYGVALGNPLESDVREGVLYGASSELEGTLIVPSPSLVAQGVPTDNTVGTLTAATPADIAAALVAYGTCKTTDLASIVPPDVEQALNDYNVAKVSDLQNVKVTIQPGYQDQYK